MLFLAQRVLERRTRLVVYYGNVGYFKLPTGDVHTHTVVVRNAGKLPAHNVRPSLRPTSRRQHSRVGVTADGL